MGSLQDLKTYMTAAAIGMLSSSGFVWLVTDSLGRLGVIATYGAGTLLVNERRQIYSPKGKELGGEYVLAEKATPQKTQTQTGSTTSPASGLSHPPTAAPIPPGSRPLSTSMTVRGPEDDVARPASVWSSHAPAGTDGHGYGNGYARGIADDLGAVPEQLTSLDTLGDTLYPLFCVSVHEHAWMAAGYGVWGKETYFERFWSCLNWAAVRDSYTLYVLRSARRYNDQSTAGVR